MSRRWLSAAGIVVATLGLAGCFPSTPTRAPIPPGLAETATLPGYKFIRTWGDEESASFVDKVMYKDIELREAAKAGRVPNGLTEANFLAISGGGDQGAFAAGVLKGWSQNGTRPLFEVVTGVSAGALGAPFAFLGPSYDDALRDMYTKLGAGNLYTSRGITGYFGDALNDTTNLREVIGHYVTEAFLDRIAAADRDGRKILILTTDLDAERPVIWDLTAIAASGQPNRREIFIKVLMASSAIPGLFPPVYFDVVAANGRHYTEMHVDGGVTAQLVFVPPALRVLDVERKVFGKVRKRSLYVIRNGKINPEYDASDPRAISIAGRAVTTLVKYQVIADLGRLDRYAKENDTAFYFCAVPNTFDAVTTGQFDTEYATKLFTAGIQVGSESLWSTNPPISPEQFVAAGSEPAGMPRIKPADSLGQ